jgi:hypothetical protein
MMRVSAHCCIAAAQTQFAPKPVGLGVGGIEYRAENWTPVFGKKTMRQQQVTASDPVL